MNEQICWGATLSLNQVNAPMLSKRPIRFSNVDGQRFVESVANVPINMKDDTDTDSLVNILSNELYNCAVRSKTCNRVAEVRDNDLGKWERLLQDRDDARVWQAIDWRENFDKVKHEKGE